MRLGDLLARGSRSSVHAYGHGAVAKVPGPSMPDAWVVIEATNAAAARTAGAPAPALLGVEDVGGRPASIWERVHGPSMWELARAQPARAAALGAQLAELQEALFVLEPPAALPRQRDQLETKVRAAAALVDPELLEALDLLPADEERTCLCHGDLHPGNVVMAPAGPVVIDWFDASLGDRVADIARSTLLLQLGADAPQHLPGAEVGTLGPLGRAYQRAAQDRAGASDAELDRWRAVQAVARIAEGIAPGDLLALWHELGRGARAPARPA